MAQVNVYEAKTHLSRLLRRVRAGEEIIIAEAGRPVARLVPLASAMPRVLGGDEGQVWIADDFDAPLPNEIEEVFYAPRARGRKPNRRAKVAKVGRKRGG